MATGTRERPSSRTRLQPGDPGLEAWGSLLTAHSQLMTTLDRELQDVHGLTLGDFDVLVHLAEHPRAGLRMCELAEAVLLSPSGISRRVDRLERDGLVVRERDSTDARNVKARLTDPGRKLFRRLRTTHLAGVQEHFIDRFGSEDMVRLRDLLSRLVDPDGDSCPESATSAD